MGLRLGASGAKVSGGGALEGVGAGERRGGLSLSLRAPPTPCVGRILEVSDRRKKRGLAGVGRRARIVFRVEGYGGAVRAEGAALCGDGLVAAEAAEWRRRRRSSPHGDARLSSDGDGDLSEGARVGGWECGEGRRREGGRRAGEVVPARGA